MKKLHPAITKRKKYKCSRREGVVVLLALLLFRLFLFLLVPALILLSGELVINLQALGVFLEMKEANMLLAQIETLAKVPRSYPFHSLLEVI